MKNEFKINSATHQAAINKMEVAASIMRKCGMSYQDWSDVLFENGCRFIEKNVRIKHLQICLLQNQAFGFWDWWLMLSLEDDESIMNYNNVVSLQSYIAEKERMLKLMEPVKQFDYFMIKNEKINELDKV